MNGIIIGLAALTNLTGMSSGMNYPTTFECYVDAANENTLTYSECYSSIDDVEEPIYDIYNIYGENRYILIEFTSDKYVLYDKKNEVSVNVFSNNPFQEIADDKLKIYDEDKLGFNFAYYDEYIKDFKCISSSSFLSSYEIHDFIYSRDKKGGEYYSDIKLTSTATVISNAYYFENLKGMHAWNSKGTCAIVSSEILLGYYDTFHSDLIVDEKYDTRTQENIEMDNFKTESFSQSPGVDNYNKDDNDFHDYLVNIARDEIGDDPEVDGMTTGNQIKLINNYLSKQGIDYTTSTSEGNLGDIWTQRAIEIIKNGINNDRPVIANGSGHSVVAYAYDDNYVWVHTGWGWCGATP